MLNKLNDVRPYSLNNNQEFMWIAEYLNGTLQSEFEIGGQGNDFKDINKQQLLRFGLVGLGYKMYYEIPTGKFNLLGRNIEVIYKTNDAEYNLTNQFVLYNDVIQYKDCWSDFNTLTDRDSHKTHSSIVGYNFGYKAKLDLLNKDLNFKAICKIPMNQPIHMVFRLVYDEDLDGKLIIRNDGITVTSTDAPLRKGFAWEYTWIMK